MRFGADTEFEHRAVYVARWRGKFPAVPYVVQNREESLTSSAETGLRSEKRLALRQPAMDRASENTARIRGGHDPLSRLWRRPKNVSPSGICWGRAYKASQGRLGQHKIAQLQHYKAATTNTTKTIDPTLLAGADGKCASAARRCMCAER